MIKRNGVIGVIAAFVFAFASFAQAAVIGNTTPQSVNINGTVNESLTLTLTGGAINLPMSGGGLSNTVTASVAYNIIPANHTQGLQSGTWLSSPAIALTQVGSGGSVVVPSSSIAMTSFYNGVSHSNATPCTLAANVTVSSVAGATCTGSNSTAEISNAALTTTPSGTLTDTYQLSYVGPTVGAGTYTGVLFVQYLIL